MWGAITEFCKIFADKHLISSVLSVTGAILVLLILPSDYWMITKIGKFMFCVFVAGVVFLAVKLITTSYQKICTYKSKNADNEYYCKSTKEDEKNCMEALWISVDKFDPDDRKLLKEFLESDNTPIIRSSGSRYFGNSLLASDWVVSTKEYGEEFTDEVQHIVVSNTEKGLSIPIIDDSFSGRKIITKYKLNDEIFNILKYSKDHYGKISHFE